MIDPTHALSIVKQAEAVGISRASVYYVPRPISAADLALMRRIDELHLQPPFMGARQLKRELLEEDIDVGRCHIRTLMQRLDIEAQCPQPPPRFSKSFAKAHRVRMIASGFHPALYSMRSPSTVRWRRRSGSDRALVRHCMRIDLRHGRALVAVAYC